MALGPGLAATLGTAIHVCLYINSCEVLEVGLVDLLIDPPTFLAGFSLCGKIANICLKRMVAGVLQLVVCFFMLRLHLCCLDLHQLNTIQHKLVL